MDLKWLDSLCPACGLDAARTVRTLGGLGASSNNPTEDMVETLADGGCGEQGRQLGAEVRQGPQRLRTMRAVRAAGCTGSRPAPGLPDAAPVLQRELSLCRHNLRNAKSSLNLCTSSQRLNSAFSPLLHTYV